LRYTPSGVISEEGMSGWRRMIMTFSAMSGCNVWADKVQTMG